MRQDDSPGRALRMVEPLRILTPWGGGSILWQLCSTRCSLSQAQPRNPPVTRQDSPEPSLLTRGLVFGPALACALLGCATGDQAAVDTALEQRAFASAYRLVDSIPLAQSDSAPVVRVSGIAFDDRGTLAVGDASEGNVKIFNRAGTLMRVIGRKGEGPAEFSQPRFPRFTPDGGLFVGDGQLGRVSRFDSSGAFVRVMTLGVVPMMGFDRSGATFVMTGLGDSGRIVLLGDSAGGGLHWTLDAERLRPSTDPDNAMWKFVTQYWLGVAGDTAFVVMTLSDSIWMIPLHGDTIRSRSLRVPGYIAPRLPGSAPSGAKGLMDWQKTFHIAAKVIATPDVIAVPFVQGVLNYGDPMILAVRRRGHEWIALTGAPPIVQAHGDTLVSLLHPLEDATTLGLYVPAAIE